MFRDKLLAYSFAASIALNAFFLILVGNSGIFQHADAIQDLRAQQIEVYKPPIPEKPRPLPKVVPQKSKTEPKIHPRRPEVKPVPSSHPKPAPTPQPAPVQNHTAQPTRPAPAVFVRTSQQSTRPNPRPDPFVPLSPHPGVAHPRVSQPVPRPAANIGSTSAQGAVVAQPSPAPVFHAAPPQPVAPQPAAQPAPRPDPTPPAPADTPKPRPRSTEHDRGTPEIVGDWGALTLPSDYDPNTLTTTRIEARWVVDKTGHARHISVPSCGNSEIDDQIRRFIEDHHYEPAVQNGEPQDCPIEHTFVIGE
ncbi:MAG TPA: hypothetical protein VFW40_11630 [Capsulimonadaceae bacterium]|nr:hypothetical protein [Capsulimonadaceae bacterium]